VVAPIGSLLSVDADHVVIEAVKAGADAADALVVRMYEAWGRRGAVTIRAPWDIRRATVTDLLERDTAPVPTVGPRVTVDVAPFQIVTLKLEPVGS
jgi:alpha-mannosidase